MSFMHLLNTIKNNRTIAVLFTITIAAVLTSFYFNTSVFEGYSNYNLANPGKYPGSQIRPLLYDSYPSTGKKTISNNTSNDIWWHYPIFEVGSYAQITNNLKYVRNPDDGKCEPAEFCGTLYKDAKVQSNVSKPLPPAPLISADTVRVNYYTTNSNLISGQPAGPELQAF